MQMRVEMLQSIAKGPQNDDVTRTQENIDNGVRITITSDDEDTAAKIQEHAAEGKGPRIWWASWRRTQGEIWEGKCDSENFAQMRELSDSIERSVRKYRQRFIITMTSDDADAVEMLQSREAKGPQNDDVTRTKRILITESESPSLPTMKTLQQKFKNMLLKAKVLEFGEHRGGGYGEVHGHRRSEEEENEGKRAIIGNTKNHGIGKSRRCWIFLWRNLHIPHPFFFDTLFLSFSFFRMTTTHQYYLSFCGASIPLNDALPMIFCKHMPSGFRTRTKKKEMEFETRRIW